MKHLLFMSFFLSILSLLSAQEKPQVVSSVSMIHDMVEVIAGDFVEASMIVPIGSDPHLYEPTPSDAALANGADLIFINGLTFEGWLEKVIENSGTQAQIVTVTEGIQAIESTEYENSYDPHAWMDVSNAIIYAQNIAQALQALIPEEAESIAFNYGVYKQQLEDLHQWVQTAIDSIPEGQRVLVTSHDAFSYYGRQYGLELYALAGVSTEADPQTSDIRRINKIVRERQLPAVFIESTVNPKLLQGIAQDNQVKIGGKLYADSLGKKNGPASTYVKMIKHNTRTIVKALSQKREASSDKEIPVKLNPIIFVALGLVMIGIIYLLLKK